MNYFIASVFLLASTLTVAFSQQPIYIDVQDDIPSNGRWVLDCPSGYQELVGGFNCRDWGRVDLPDEDNFGQRGFWTKCQDRCRITYYVQSGDNSFAARVYLRNLPLEISYDGVSWEFESGDGWMDIKKNLDPSITQISMQFDHLHEEYFVLLDKIAVNADLPPLEPVPRTTEIEQETTDTDLPPTTTEADLPPPTTEAFEETTLPSTPSEATTMETTEPTISTTRRDPSTIYIDVENDIPADGSWHLDCPDGYQRVTSDFDCINSGRVDLPDEDLSGQIGFWTNCADRCLIKYIIQPGDTTYKARVYQRNLPTEISYDGFTWEFIPGEGWVDIERDLREIETEISLRFDHLAPEFFVVLDKIAVNGNLPPIQPAKAEEKDADDKQDMGHFEKLLHFYNLL